MSDRTFSVEWAEPARRDLETICLYVARERPMAALKLLQRIEARAAALSSLPKRGRVVPELAAVQVRSYLELQVPPYRLIYRIAGERVFVVAVLDGRRDLEDLLLERLLET